MIGIVCINKQKGMTSSNVVVKVRNTLTKVTGEKIKVGHFGTLDPDGMGVLIIGVGKATKLFDYTLNKTKVYKTAFCFGAETDTLDSSGKVVKICDKIPTVDEVKKTISTMIGKQMQVPPRYSALSINGVRAYKLARAGQDIKFLPREIEIYNFQFLDKNNERFEFLIKCSSGTYVRSIARDLAEKLNTLGYMDYIIREKSGEVSINNCVTLDEFVKSPLQYVKPIDPLLSNFSKFEITHHQEEFLHGVKIEYDNLPKDNFVVIMNGEILGIGYNKDGILKIKTRLN